MTRNELKQLWFSIPRNENKKDYKVIVVEIGKNPYWKGYGTIQIISDTKDGYSSFKTSQGENALNYALECEQYKTGKYNLVIK